MFDEDKFFGTLHEYLERAIRPLALRIREIESRPTEKGEKGDPGEAGAPGKDADMDALNGHIDLSVLATVNDCFEKNASMLKGDRGEKGEPGEAGKEGAAGRDGESPTPEAVALAMEGHFAKWALDFERRANDLFQRAIDRIPAPKDGRDGADGKDGLGFDDVSVEHDGERGFTIKFQRDGAEKAFQFTVPAVIDKGVWKDGAQAQAGDGMTYGGSYWIAKQDTAEKPGLSDHWRLAVRKGRDGKDGRDGERGEKGPQGIPGLNGRSLS